MFEPGRAIIFAISSKRISPLARLHPAEGHCVVEASQGSFDQQPQSRSRYRLSLRTDSATEQELRIVRWRGEADPQTADRCNYRKQERRQPKQSQETAHSRAETWKFVRKVKIEAVPNVPDPLRCTHDPPPVHRDHASEGHKGKRPKCRGWVES
jgi:hypothetical protein